MREAHTGRQTHGHLLQAHTHWHMLSGGVPAAPQQCWETRKEERTLREMPRLESEQLWPLLSHTNGESLPPCPPRPYRYIERSSWRPGYMV